MLRCVAAAGRFGLPAAPPPCAGAAFACPPAASGASFRLSALPCAAGAGAASREPAVVPELLLAQPASPAVRARPRIITAVVPRRAVLSVMRLRRGARRVRFRQTGGWTITIE